MKKVFNNKVGINLLMINAFVYISFSLYAPFLSSYYTKVGISAVQIGILLTIAPVTAIFIQPLWAVISDRTGRRRDLLSFVVLGSAISMFSYYIGKSFLSFFIASSLLAIFSTSIVPLSDAILLRTAHKNKLDFSKIRMGGTIGFSIVVIIAGLIIKQNPGLQFAMGFVGYLSLFCFVRGLPKDEKDESAIAVVSTTKLPFKERFNIFHVFESKQIIFVLAFAFLSQVGLSFNFSFLGVYMVKLGLSDGMIGIINSVSAFSELPVLFLINRILKKASTMKITVLACLLLSLRIITVTGGSVGFIALSQAMHGITYMTIYYSCAVFISKNVKPENQSKGQSILAVVQGGIGSIVGNILGGFLVDAFGLKSAYISMSVIIVIASSLLTLLQLFVINKRRYSNPE